MAKSRQEIIHRIVSGAAIAVMALYVCYSAAAVSADICLCWGMSCPHSIENNAAHCCAEDGQGMGCCLNEIPVQNEPFHPPFDVSAYRNNISDVQSNISNGPDFAELLNVACEEEFTPQNISYFIFRPPKV